MEKTFAASCSPRQKEVPLGNFCCPKKKKVSLGDGVDFDPIPVTQRVRHELIKTKMQAHIYGTETVRSELDGRTPPSQQYNSSTTSVEQHVPTNP